MKEHREQRNVWHRNAKEFQYYWHILELAAINEANRISWHNSANYINICCIFIMYRSEYAIKYQFEGLFHI